MEDFYTFIEIIVIFVIGYYVGAYITVMKMLNLYAQLTGKELDLEDIENSETEEEYIASVARSMFFKTETINDVMYVYSMDENTFVCQGSTIEELCKKCREYTKLSDVFVFHEKQAYHYDGEVIEKVKHEN